MSLSVKHHAMMKIMIVKKKQKIARLKSAASFMKRSAQLNTAPSITPTNAPQKREKGAEISPRTPVQMLRRRYVKM